MAYTFATPGPSLEALDPQKLASQERPQSLKRVLLAGLACTFARPGPSLEAFDPQEIVSQGRSQFLTSRPLCKARVYFC